MQSVHIPPQPSPTDFSIPAHVLRCIEEDIVPHIIECSNNTQNAFDIDPTYNNNYTVGTYSWNNLFQRCISSLNRTRWTVRTYENDLTVSIIHKKKTYEFRIHRCDPITRVPTGGKQAKACACGQLMLSDEIEHTVRTKAHLTIGYDLDAFLGLGSITVDQLSGTSPTKVIAFTLATLYKAEPISPLENLERPTPEHVSVPEPTMEPGKKAKKKSIR